MQLTLEDLRENERKQFEKAIEEGDSGAREWVTLMWMTTIIGGHPGGNQGAFERRQAIRQLYQSERARREAANSPGSPAEDVPAADGTGDAESTPAS